MADVRAPTPSAAAEIVIAEKDHQLKQIAQIQERLQHTLQHLIRHDRKRLEGIMRHPLLLSPYGILGPWMQKLDALRQDIDQNMAQQIIFLKSQIESRHKLLLSLKPTNQIGHFKQKLLTLDKSLRIAFHTKLQHWKKRVAPLENSLRQAWLMQLQNKKRLLNVEVRQKQIDQLMYRHLLFYQQRVKQVADALHSVDPKNLLSKGYAILFAEKDHSVITSIHAVERNQDVRLLLHDGEIISTVKNIIESEQKP